MSQIAEFKAESWLDELPGLRLDPDAGAPVIVGSLMRTPARLDVVREV